MNGIGDIDGGIISHACLESCGQLGFDFIQFLPDIADHIERVRVRQHPHAHEHGLLAAEAHGGVVIFGAEFHIGDVLEPHHRTAALAQDELLELLHRLQVGVRGEIDGDERAFGLADGGEVVVSRQRTPHLGRADIQRRHAVGLQPDAHGKSPAAEDFGALHAGDSGQSRLNDPREVIGDFIRLEDVRDETQVSRRALRVRAFDVDHRHLGLGRQVAAHLIDLGADLGKRLRRVVIELQPGGDDRASLQTLGLHIIDAIRCRDGALDRCGDETSNEIRIGPDIDRGDGHRGVVAARVLANGESQYRLSSRHEDEERHHHGQNRAANEEVGKGRAARIFTQGIHQEFSGVGAAVG